MRKQQNTEEIHKMAYEEVCSFIEEKIIVKREIIAMTELTEIYISKLENTEDFNPNYRAHKLKVRKNILIQCQHI